MRKWLVLVALAVLASAAFGQTAYPDTFVISGGETVEIMAASSADTVYTGMANQSRTWDLNDLPDFEFAVTAAGDDTLGFVRRAEVIPDGLIEYRWLKYEDVGWVLRVTDMSAASNIYVSGWYDWLR